MNLIDELLTCIYEKGNEYFSRNYKEPNISIYLTQSAFHEILAHRCDYAAMNQSYELGSHGKINGYPVFIVIHRTEGLSHPPFKVVIE